MTVLTETLQITYVNNDGVARVFAIPFPFIEPEHLQVARISPAGTAEVLTLGGHYTVTAAAGDDDGHNVSLLEDTVFPSGWKLRIQRVMPYVQPTDYLHQGAMLPETNEISHDRAVMLIQQLLAQIGALEQVVAGLQYSDPDHGASVLAYAAGGYDVPAGERLPIYEVIANDGGIYNHETAICRIPASGRYYVAASATGGVDSPANAVQIAINRIDDVDLARGTVGAPAQSSTGWQGSSHLAYTLELAEGDEIRVYNYGSALTNLRDARFELRRV